LATVIDAALEATVVGSFSRVGIVVRRATQRWSDDSSPSLKGKTALITGATSGIGLAAAIQLAKRGAAVRIVGRNEAKAAAAHSTIRRAAGEVCDVDFDVVDMSDFDAVRAFAARFTANNAELGVLVHNAGALTADYHQAPSGCEATLAAQVLGPFLLTSLLLPTLRAASDPATVITVSSGGMYAERLDLSHLEMTASDYKGATAYARAKRAQVVLNHEWSSRVPSEQIVFHAMHPGWVDTPGVESGLPTFYRVMKPLLRSPDDGADTIVWLAGNGSADSGHFWLDRRRRSEHHLPWTRGGDGNALWDYCVKRTGAAVS
jgi:NAD(P)-dependent dehydrogenase (short-subunit alcohol dehydrogenase family)